MSIKQKTMILVLIILVATVFGLYPVVSRVLLGGFARLEDQDAENNSQRLKAAFTEQYSELTTKAMDWAHWDDALAFVQKKGNVGGFIQSNFVDSEFRESQLDLIAFLDLNGSVVCAREYASDQQKQVPPSADLAGLLSKKAIWQHRDASDSISGMALLSKGPLLFAAVPVTNSDGNPPHAGTVVFGRYFDQARMKALSEKTQLACSFTQTPKEVSNSEYRNYMHSWQKAPMLLLRPNETTISAISAISDFEGKDALFYQVDLPRNIYGEARRSLKLTFWVLILAGVALGVIIYLLLDRLVVSRIRSIHGKLEKVMETDNYDSLLDVRTTDEISNLAESINGLLAAESTIIHMVPDSAKTGK